MTPMPLNEAQLRERVQDLEDEIKRYKTFVPAADALHIVAKQRARIEEIEKENERLRESISLLRKEMELQLRDKHIKF